MKTDWFEVMAVLGIATSLVAVVGLSAGIVMAVYGLAFL